VNPRRISATTHSDQRLAVHSPADLPACSMSIEYILDLAISNHLMHAYGVAVITKYSSRYALVTFYLGGGARRAMRVENTSKASQHSVFGTLTAMQIQS